MKVPALSVRKIVKLSKIQFLLPGVISPLDPPQDVDLFPLPGQETVDHHWLASPEPAHNPPHHVLQDLEGSRPPAGDLSTSQPPGGGGGVPGEVGESVVGGEEVGHDVGQVRVNRTECTLEDLVRLTEPHLHHVLQTHHGGPLEEADQLGQQTPGGSVGGWLVVCRTIS